MLIPSLTLHDKTLSRKKIAVQFKDPYKDSHRIAQTFKLSLKTYLNLSNRKAEVLKMV